MSQPFDFWPVLAVIIALVLGVVGVGTVLLTWRDNRRMDRAINGVKQRGHA